MISTVAHLSDLHLGRDARGGERVLAACEALVRAGVDEVVVTGDVTHRGRRDELAQFERAFERLSERVVVVPGNHDRLGDDVARLLMPGRRVDVEVRRGLYLVRVDSTAAHNVRKIACHGELTASDLAEIDRAVSAAPRGLLVTVLLHHHVLPIPEDHLVERVASWLGWPHALEIERGRDLVELLLGRCDLVLHGHRHAATEREVASRCGRTLRILNAGCTPDRGAFRVVSHERGRIVAERWIELGEEPSGTMVPDPLAAA